MPQQKTIPNAMRKYSELKVCAKFGLVTRQDPCIYNRIIVAFGAAWDTVCFCRTSDGKMNFVYVLSVVLFISKTSGESSATSGPTDETQTPSASGPNVVETTIRRIDASCSFDDNTLFLRRLAYVESTDGLHPDTFRSGYYGGIWQVRSVDSTGQTS